MDTEIQFSSSMEILTFYHSKNCNAKRIKELLKSIRQDPFKGIGKPEPLRHDLKGFWSRRITDEHRLVYKITGTKGVDQKCIVLQCRFHYD